MLIVSSPENYAAYLNVQGQNPMYSFGNIALAMIQNPSIMQIGTVERWKAQSRYVLDAEKNKGVQIYTKGEFSKGYTIGMAYDVSQTAGREITPPKQITEDSQEMEKALYTLMNYAVVEIVADKELPTPAFYDKTNLELCVNPTFSEPEVFYGLAAEITHSRIHNKGRNIHYNREQSDLDAQSVAYLLCKRFGIKAEMPDLSSLNEAYGSYTAPEIKQAMGYIQDMSKQIGGSIEKSISPPQHGRGNMRRPAR